jgi:hypothetical protein
MEIVDIIIVLVLIAIAVVLIVLFATGVLNKGGQSILDILHLGKQQATTLLKLYITA